MEAYIIHSQEDYQRVMERVEIYLKKATQEGGFHKLEPTERADLQRLSRMAEVWEDQIPLMPIRQPQTLIEMIELKMYELKLKQKDLASLLGIPASRLSEIMQNKRKINLDFAQRLYKKLNIDPAFILEKA